MLLYIYYIYLIANRPPTISAAASTLFHLEANTTLSINFEATDDDDVAELVYSLDTNLAEDVYSLGSSKYIYIILYCIMRTTILIARRRNLISI